MATTTISELPEALRMLETMMIPVDVRDPISQVVTTERVTLTQILELFESIGNIPPTGTAHLWPTDLIPINHLELNGQSFDKLALPGLGLIFPSGILPDWRGRVPKHANDGLSAGELQEDQIKAHAHEITLQSTDLGTKTTNSKSHAHSRGTMRITGNSATSVLCASYSSSVYGEGAIRMRQAAGSITWSSGSVKPYKVDFDTNMDAAAWTGETSSASLSFSVAIGSHSHSATCSEVGGAENRVKSVLVRYIVRAR